MDDIATEDVNFFSFFLKQGVDPNTFDKVSSAEVMVVAVIITVSHLQDDRHPLFYATYYGRRDLAELLIEHGADVDLATNVRKIV